MGQFNKFNNIIVINRGDTFSFDFTIIDDLALTGRYSLTDEDTVYFGLMRPHSRFEDAILKKRFTKDDCDDKGHSHLQMVISAEDTIDLQPGVYYYSVKLHRVDTKNNIDRVVTIINKTKFIIND